MCQTMGLSLTHNFRSFADLSLPASNVLHLARSSPLRSACCAAANCEYTWQRNRRSECHVLCGLSSRMLCPVLKIWDAHHCTSYTIFGLPHVSQRRSAMGSIQPSLPQIPDPHAVVVAGGGKHRATRMEIHCHNLAMGFQAWMPSEDGFRR